MGRRLRDRRTLVVAVVALAVVVVAVTALARRESQAYKTGRAVGAELYKSGTPIEKCANVRAAAGLVEYDTEEEQRDFYEGCRAGYDDVADR